MDDGATTGEEPRHRLDLRGLKCPLPALLTRRALGRLGPGRLLEVLCTDPLAGIDIPHLVAHSRDALVGTARDGNRWIFLIRRGAGAGGGDQTETSPR